MENKVLILDFGSQYTQLIARRVRELKVYSEIIPCWWEFDEELMKGVKAIILSGGPNSVTDSDAPEFDQRWINSNKPVLGICYGMQLISNIFNGKVSESSSREYGSASLIINDKNSLIFDRVSDSKVWMSHGDHVSELPDGFKNIASSNSITNAAIENTEKSIYCFQFHPEVFHSDLGADMISNFLFKVSNIKADWTGDNFINSQIEKIKQQVGTGKAICALSGGVDSAVAAVLVNKALNGNLKCFFVDNGLLRKNEVKRVVSLVGEKGLGLDLEVVDAKELFLGKLKGVTDPEQKRKIIGTEFIRLFEDCVKDQSDVTHLVQGTLYPDVIESVSAKGPSNMIKSHHNVGGLPDDMKFKLIEPFRELFKDEVRKIGQLLEIDDQIIKRQPFPGPGLAVRILGEVTKEGTYLLQEADSILQEEIKKHGFYDKLWQSFCVLLPIKTVGVMGDQRTYEKAIAIRAVESVDGMTATWAYLPKELLEVISSRIINEVKGINRVTLDISSKPPATIEWE